MSPRNNLWTMLIQAGLIGAVLVFVTFCLNAGLMYGAYTAFDHGNPALGGVIAFVETGFYAGNICGSVSGAHKYNKALQIKILGREFNLNAGVDPITHSYLFSPVPVMLSTPSKVRVSEFVPVITPVAPSGRIRFPFPSHMSSFFYECLYRQRV